VIKGKIKISRKELNISNLVESFSIRLMQKFKKIGNAFRHFDRDFDNQISFKEFRIVCEEMDLRYSSDEIEKLFGYLDSDGGGSIGYLEFTKLLDEKRKGLDPFTNQQN
jgi:Ca2+-binding EF-hand superfamily protein